MNIRSAFCAGSAAAAWAVSACVPPACGAVPFTVAARSSAPIPGLPNARYGSFGAASINDHGVIAVGGYTSGQYPGEALFSGAAGDVRVIMHRGDRAPGTSGGLFQMPLGPTLNAAGQVLFVGNLLTGYGDTTEANKQGLWLHTPGQPMEMIARNGSLIPGTSGKTFKGYNYLATGDGGDVGFVSGVLPADNPGLSTGLFARSPGGPLVTVGVDGMPAPGFSTTFQGFDGGGVNARGQIAFDARHNGSMNSAWAGTPGALTKLAHWGAPSPVNGSVYGQVFNAVKISSGGHAIFQGYFEGGGGEVPTFGSGIFSGPIGAVKAVARTGQSAPGTTAQFGIQLSTTPQISADNYITFDASLTGDGVTSANDSGLWIGSAAEGFNLVAREGDVAPGTGGAAFGEFLNTAFLSIDEGGSGAFRMNLTGPGVTAANAGSIWSFDSASNLQLIARMGDTINVDGVMRTINLIRTNFGANGDNGFATSLANDRFAYTANFTDGSSAVLIAHVPEPSACGLILITLAATLGRRTRRD